MNQLLGEIFIVSCCFFLAFLLVTLLPDFMFWGGTYSAETACLLFLPHGVRVLVAWMYGYRSVVLLAPASIITHFFQLDGADFDLGFYLGPLFGIICAATAFDVCARLGFDVRLRDNFVANWRNVFIVGAVSSVINSVGANISFGNDISTAIAYWVGDVSGLFVTMLILMVVFRMLRLHSRVS